MRLAAPRERTGKASAQAAGENRENDGQENLRLASGPRSAMPCCAGAIAAQQARIGAEKRHQDEHGGGWKVVKDGAAPAPAEEEEPFEETRKKGPKAIVLRICNGFLDFLNSTALQTTAYLIFVLVFQTLTESMRKKEEYYFDRVRPRPPRRCAAALRPPPAAPPTPPPRAPRR